MSLFGPLGSFLVRESKNEHLLNLSFRTEFGIFHSKIEHSNGHFSFGSTSSHPSVMELIDEMMDRANRGVFLYTAARSQPFVFSVRLINPLLRSSQLQSGFL